MKTDCAVLITAAGLSGRMGVSKALLKWNEEMNFLQKIIAAYSDFGCSEIIITLNEETFEYFNSLSMSSVLFVLNPYPELERMFSIQLGMKSIKKSTFCFIQTVDNPFVEIDLLEKIYQCKSKDKYVTPTYQEKSGHPILINNRIINHICQMNIEKKHLKEVLNQFPRKLVEVENPEIFYNINTMEDYQKLIAC
ncbi:MAG: nucleotidyltransferase family protein [Bacteroidales bacterium]